MDYLKYIEPALKLLILITAVAWWFFHSKSSAKKMAKELEIAKKDIIFLLHVEEAYGDEMRAIEGSSLKNQMRGRVKMMGHSWSGKFTRSTILAGKDVSGIDDAKTTVIEKLLK